MMNGRVVSPPFSVVAVGTSTSDAPRQLRERHVSVAIGVVVRVAVGEDTLPSSRHVAAAAPAASPAPADAEHARAPLRRIRIRLVRLSVLSHRR